MTNSFFYVPIVRGACFLSLGVVVYEPITDCIEKIDGIKKAGLVINAAIILLCIAFFKDANEIGFVVMFLLSFSRHNLINKKLNSWNGLKYLEDLTLAIYFSHVLIIKIFRTFIGNNTGTKETGLYLIILTLFAILLVNLIKRIKKMSFKETKRIS